jgi:hypothetical protein
MLRLIEEHPDLLRAEQRLDNEKMVMNAKNFHGVLYKLSKKKLKDLIDNSEFQNLILNCPIVTQDSSLKCLLEGYLS